MALASAVGIGGTIASSWTYPSQITHLVRHRKDHRLLRGVSFPTLLIVAISSLFWMGYGYRFNGVWSAVIATADLAVQLFILALFAAYARPLLPHRRHLVLGAALTLATAVLAATGPRPLLGAAGALSAAAMFLPQVRKVVTAWGTPAAAAFSPVASLAVSGAASLWLTYGILLHDGWIIAPAPFNICTGLAMFSAWLSAPRKHASTRRYFRKQPTTTNSSGDTQ